MSGLFDVQSQLVFYGSYHANRTNILIHMICVPLLIWSALVIFASFQPPAFFPSISHDFNSYLAFDMNYATIFSAVYLTYYYALLPSAALLYTPQMLLSLLTATAFARSPNHFIIAAGVQFMSWIAQFLGHGLAEKRAPALLDNIVGAFILAPFFVHLEMLFELGFYPELHKGIQAGVDKELLRLKSDEEAKKRKEL